MRRAVYIRLLSALTAVMPSVKATQQNYSTLNLAGIDLSTLPDNSLFTRWRPISHFMAPHSWMNDPCGPSYDPSSGLYHLFYQYHPGYIVWGNISWGHATSEDLVTWTDINGWQAYDSVALAPGPQGSLDGSGVYTGSAQFLATNESWGLPTQEEADNSEQDLMLIFYTAVNGSNETQTLAMSYDGGYTFSKLEGTGININPVIANPPPNLSVTGFRDPHLEPWPEMDSILDADEPHFYAVIGSGITDVGPRLQFYTAPASNMTQWTYLGPLFSAAGNASWSETYSGTYGYNFEVPGAFSLPELVENGGDGVTLHYFVTMGSDASTFLHPLTNWPLWSEINITRSTNGSAEGTILSSGVIDWGQSYAWNSFYDKPHDRRIGFGWIPEDLGAPALRPQGWVGATTLPRELYVQVYQNLANTNGILSQHGSWTAVQDSNNRWSMTTLAMRPAPDVVAALQQNATVTRAESIPMSASTQLQFYSLNVSSDSIIIHAEIDIPTNATSDVGFVLRRSPDGEEQTLITYDPVRETLTMNLTSSTLLNSTFVGTANHIAPLFLLETYVSANSSDTIREPLTFDIVLDNSVVEVFANSRIVMTGHTYPARNDSLEVGCVVGIGDGQVEFRNVSIWEGLQRAWPERPDNSSMPIQ